MTAEDATLVIDNPLLSEHGSRPAAGPADAWSRAIAHVRPLPGVYGPADDSRLLAASLVRENLAGARVLDLCTGTGILAATAALAGAAEVAAVDVSWRAAFAARLAMRRAGVGGTVRRGDLVHAAPPGPYDLIVSNPPYVPGAGEGPPAAGATRAWDAGLDGRAIIDRICTEAPAMLRPGGVLMMIHSEVSGEARTLEMLAASGLDASVVARHLLPFGPVMKRRAPDLRAAGLISEDQDVEELVVIRAVAPQVA